MLGLNGYMPFGEGMLNNNDTLKDVAFLCGGWNRFIEGSESFFYSLHSGGVERHAFLPGTLNFVFPDVFLGRLIGSDYTESISWTILFQIILCSWSCYFYLSRTFRRLDVKLVVLLAFSYAFSRTFFMSGTAITLYSPAIIFPIFLYSLDLLLKRRKWGLYLGIMVFMLAATPYFSWMFALFASLYALVYTGFKTERADGLPILFFLTVVAALLTAFSWLPSLEILGGSQRANQNVEWFRFAGTARSFDIWLITPATLALIAVSLNRWRVNRYLVSMVILISCLVFIPWDQIWHGGDPIGFFGRNSHMVSMMGCCYAASVCRAPSRKGYTTIILPACILGGFIILAFARGFLTNPGVTWAFLEIAIGGLVLTLLLIPTFCMREYRYAIAFILYLVVLPIVIHFHYAASQNKESTQAQYLSVAMPMQAAAQLRGALEQTPYARVAGKGQFERNFAEYTGLYSISNFFHSSGAGAAQAHAKLGYLSFFTTLSDEGGTLFSDSFLGIRYACHLVCHDALNPHLTLELGEDTRLYENPFFWGNGVLCHRPASPPSSELDVWEYQNALFQTLGGDGAVMQPVEYRIQTSPDGRQVIVFPGIGPQDLIYTDLPLEYEEGGQGQEVCIADANKWKGWEVHSLPLSLLPSSKGEPAVVHVDPAHPDIMDGTCHFYRLDTDKLMALSQHKKGQVSISSLGRQSIDVDVRPTDGEGYLVLPFYYLDTLKAEVDGQPVHIDNFMGFIGIDLQQARACHVTISYEAPDQAKGVVISIGTLLLAFAAYTLRRKLQYVSEMLRKPSLVGLALLWAGILLIPLGISIATKFM